MATKNGAVQAHTKCWVSRKGHELVTNENPDACILFARAGQILPRYRVSNFTNASEFFYGIAEPEIPADGKPAEEPPAVRRGRPLKATANVSHD